MPFTRHAIHGDASAWHDAPLVGLSGRIEHNLGSQSIADEKGRLGSTPLSFSSNQPPDPETGVVAPGGAFSVDMPATDDAAVVAQVTGTLQYRVVLNFTDPGGGGRRTWDSGWFSLTADVNVFTVDGAVSPEAAASGAAFLAEMEAIRDAAIAPTEAQVRTVVTTDIPNPASEIGAALSETFVPKTDLANLADPEDVAGFLTQEAAEAAAAAEVETQMGTSIGQTVTQKQNEDQARAGKGGKIGTAGKGVIAFRIDHQLDPHLAKVAPLFWARKVPYGIGLVTQSVGNLSATYEPTNTTWAQVRSEVCDKGGSLWAHSRTHANPISPATLYDEIVGSKLDIEAQGEHCQGWQQPGGPSTYGTFHLKPEDMNDQAGRIIRDNFALYESEMKYSSVRLLPTDGCRGLNHTSISNTVQMSVASTLSIIDQARWMPAGVELMLHPNDLDKPGYLTTAEFTQILDYVVALRDAGHIEILTPEGLAFADPATDHRPSLIINGDFEGYTAGTRPRPWDQTPASAWQPMSENGRGFLRMPAGRSGGAIWRERIDWMGAYGRAWELRYWARANGAVHARTTFTFLRNEASYSPALYVPPNMVANTWTFHRRQVVLPRQQGTAQNLAILFNGPDTHNIDLQGVELVAV